MKKNVYSLVLSEDVVDAVDRLAYRRNTNRSNMINQILAEYVSYTTPEKRSREVFDSVRGYLTVGDAFQLLLQPSDTLLSLRSALAYKYNPTVRYALELYRTDGNEFGELRVSLRTQNAVLLTTVRDFFILWAKTEQKYLGVTDSRLENGRFVRRLCLRSPDGKGIGDYPAETLGEGISAYIRCLDEALKAFFEDPVSGDAEEELAIRYRKYLADCGFTV